MKFIKPLTLGLLTKPYTHRGQHVLCVVALGFFRLGEPTSSRLLPEPAQWPLVMDALPPRQPLDEVMPKAHAEALVLGELPTGTPRLRLWNGAHAHEREPSVDVCSGPFGPLPIQADSRMRHAGSYPAGAAVELAPDVDWRLYNQAPEGQQLPQPHWLAGSRYLLSGLGADQGALAGKLPTPRVRAFALPEGVRSEAAAGTMRELPLQPDTLWLVPQALLGVMAWRGLLPIADSDALDVQALLLAYEDAALPPRSRGHYAQVMTQRLNPITAAAHAFDEGQIAPKRDAAELQAQQLAEQQEQAKHRDQQAQTLKTVADMAGMSQEALAQSQPAPAIQGPSAAAIAAGDFDLSELLANAKAIAEQGRAQAQAQREALLQAHPFPPNPLDDESGQAGWEQVLSRAATPMNAQRATGRRLSPKVLPEVLAPDQASALRLGQQILQWHAQGLSLAGRDLAGANLRGANLAGAVLRGCLLERADLSAAQLSGCDLSQAVLTQAQLAGAVFDKATLNDANLVGVQAQSASFTGAKLQRVQAQGGQFMQTQAQGADWSGAQLQDADFTGAQCAHSVLEGTLLNKAVLRHSQWRGARFTRCVAWQLKAEGADFSGSHWERSALIEAELMHTRWHKARLVQVQGGYSNWRGADLSQARAERSGWPQADLREAVMREAGVLQCDLGRANLSAAVLERACFARSLFLQADLRDAQGRGADFFQCLLRKADARGAELQGANLVQADVTGLRAEPTGAAA